MNRRIALGIVGDLLAAGDEDELVVGGDAELVDRLYEGLLARELELHALDVAEAAEHRLGATAEHRLQQVEADVDLLDVGGVDAVVLEDRLQVGRLVRDPGGHHAFAGEVGRCLDLRVGK